MADKIRVNTDLLARCSNELKEVAQGFGAAASILSGLNTGEEWWGKMGQFGTIRLQDEGSSVTLGDGGAAVRALTAVLRRYDSRMTRLGERVAAAGSLFDSEESRLAGRANAQSAGEDAGFGSGGGTGSGSSADYDQMTWYGLATALGYPRDPSGWSDKMRQNFEDALRDGTRYIDSTGRVILITGTKRIVTDRDGSVTVIDRNWRKGTAKVYEADGSYYELKHEGKIGSTLWKDKVDRDEVYNDWWNSLNDENYKRPSRERTLFEVGVEASATISAFHADSKYENDYFSCTSSVDVNKLSGVAKINGGLYQTKLDKDGNTVRVLEPGIAAELGISYSMFEATNKGRLGNDIVGLDYGVTVKGPAASAKVSTEIGIVDGQLAVHAGASAEAILGEISGEAGVDLMGVEAKVKAGVNFGVGAHADLGFHDGVVSCDLGVSVGVGGSIKFELDYGKAAENLVQGVRDAYSNATETIQSLKSTSRGLFGL